VTIQKIHLKKKMNYLIIEQLDLCKMHNSLKFFFYMKKKKKKRDSDHDISIV